MALSAPRSLLGKWGRGSLVGAQVHSVSDLHQFMCSASDSTVDLSAVDIQGSLAEDAASVKAGQLPADSSSSRISMSVGRRSDIATDDGNEICSKIESLKNTQSRYSQCSIASSSDPGRRLLPPVPCFPPPMPAGGLSSPEQNTQVEAPLGHPEQPQLQPQQRGEEEPEAEQDIATPGSKRLHCAWEQTGDLSLGAEDGRASTAHAVSHVPTPSRQQQQRRLEAERLRSDVKRLRNATAMAELGPEALEVEQLLARVDMLLGPSQPCESLLTSAKASRSSDGFGELAS